ncbi:MAG: DEAD/DEAH box helicase family protein [Candidatus Heimdallarchaeota archaeon]
MTETKKNAASYLEYRLIDNVFTELSVKDAIHNIFNENGTVYLIAGYFSFSGYNIMKSSIKDFLHRNMDNKIIIIIGTEPNQFSATIAYDLWELSDGENVSLLKFENHFLHTKHYVRENDQPIIIIGSANFTHEGLKENLELVSYYKANSLEDPIAIQHINWFKQLISRCEAVTDEDLEIYQKLRIDESFIEDIDILEKLSISIDEIKQKLLEPDPYPYYKLNLLSHYLEIEDTSKSTIAVKSRIKRYPHQIIAGSQAYRNLSYHGFYLLADEVGLGKSFEAALAYKQLKFTKKVSRAIIVCRSSAMSDWEEVLERFYEKPYLLTPSNKQTLKEKGFSERDIWKKSSLLICTHQMFRKALEDNKTNENDWDLLILDEAHVVKNDSSKIHQLIKLCNIPYKLFLTATPVQNEEKEFYNIFEVMQRGFLGTNYSAYKQRGERELQELLQGDVESLLTRYLREDIPYMKIPPRKVNDIFIKLSEEELDIYKTFLEFLSDLVDKNPHAPLQFVSTIYQKIAASSWFSLEVSMKRLRKRYLDSKTKQLTLVDFETTFEGDIESYLNEHRQEYYDIDIDLLNLLISKIEKSSIDSKIDNLIDSISKILEKDDRIVIFSQYKTNLISKTKFSEKTVRKNLLKLLKESDKISCPIYSYHGGLNSSERYNIRKRFEKKGGIFLSTAAGAESINLQHCNTMINYDIPWNPARIEQRIGRIQRLGQKQDEILVFNFILSDTLDESIYRRIIQKFNILQEKFGSSEGVTELQTLDAVESGSFDNVEPTSAILVRALQERRKADDITAYFDKALIEREEEMQSLKEQMKERLEDFDKRIKVLFTKEKVDHSKTEQEITELSIDYKNILKSYLHFLRFTENIHIEFNENEVVLSGNIELLGDNNIRVAIDGETSIYEDIPLLSPSSAPLSNLLSLTKKTFSLSVVKFDEGIIFDYLINIQSPINTIQKVIRIKSNKKIAEVLYSYPTQIQAIDDEISVSQRYLLKLLKITYSKIEKTAQQVLDKEKEILQKYISSEITRLLKKQSEETREEIRKKVDEPLRLQEKKVESYKKKFKNNEITAKELESAKVELNKRRNEEQLKKKKIRKDFDDKYNELVKQVNEKGSECKYNIRLLSICVMK